MTDAETNFPTPITFKRIALFVTVLIALLLSPFALIELVDTLLGNDTFGTIVGGLWGTLLVWVAYTGWDTVLVKYLKAKFNK